jgi:hypothetical protein
VIRVCGAEYLIQSNFRFTKFDSIMRYLYRYAKLQPLHDTRRGVAKISVFYLCTTQLLGFPDPRNQSVAK